MKPRITNEAEYQDAIQKLDDMWDRGEMTEEFYELENAVMDYEGRMASEVRVHPVYPETLN